MRYDAADGFYWLTTRAYDPTLGRFLARDPLGRVPLYFADNSYVYAGNNPLSIVDPSGQYRAAGQGGTRVGGGNQPPDGAGDGASRDADQEGARHEVDRSLNH